MSAATVERETEVRSAAIALTELAVAARAADAAAGDAARSGRLRVELIDASLAAHRLVDEAAEQFRRRYFPRSPMVIATAVFGVHVASPKGQRWTIVYEPERTPAPW